MEGFFKIELNIGLEPMEIWEALFEQTSKWWPAEMLTSTRTKSFHIEPKLNGSMFEDFGVGEGLIWGKVIQVDKPFKLTVQSFLSPAFGGPAFGYLSFEIEGLAEGSRLIIKDHAIGPRAEQNVKGQEEGWNFVFKERFLAFLIEKES